MPSYATDTTYEYEVFRGTTGDLASIGGREVRELVKTVPGPFGDPTDRFEGPDGRTITAGDVYRREVIETEPGVFTFGAWHYAGRQGDEALKLLKALNPNRVAISDPGAPLRNPLGWPVFLADGTRPTRPASGEQDLDPWTGEPLVDESGDPVLVP